MRFTIFLIITLFIFGTSCTKEHDIIDIDEDPFTPKTNVEVESLVISIGEDIPFTCSINGQDYVSDGGGILLISKLLLDRGGSIALIKSEGYYNEVRYIIPSLGANIYLEVTMTNTIPDGGITKEIEGFNAKTGATITIYRNDFTFKPNTIVDASGNLYEGEVKVFANSTFTFAFVNNIKRFPQNYFRENDIGKTLNIVGGHNLLLKDEMMNPLFLKEGSTANVSFEAKTSESIIIPDVLNIMSYNIDTDEWLSMGVAEREGDIWNGEINSIGIIAWGELHESRAAQIKLITDGGVIVPNKFVYLFTDLETPFSIATSDSDGLVRIQVPIGEEYYMISIEKKTPDFLVRKEFPVADIGNGELLELEDFILTSELYHIYKGNIVDCHGEIVLNSAVIGKRSDDFGHSDFISYVFSDANGIFNYAYPKVNSNTLTLSAFDYDSNITSSEFSIVNNDDSVIEFGNLLICEDYEFFINYNIEGKVYTYAFESSVITTFIDPGYESIFTSNAIMDADEENVTSFTIEHDLKFQLNGTYPIRNLSIKFNDGVNIYSFDCSNDCTHFIKVLEATTESYVGIIKYTDNSNSEAILGTFRISRQ